MFWLLKSSKCGGSYGGAYEQKCDFDDNKFTMKSCGILKMFFR